VEDQITCLVGIEGNSSFTEIVLNLGRRRGSMRDSKILLCLLGRVIPNSALPIAVGRTGEASKKREDQRAPPVRAEL
jgi:hypothetical protein